MDKQRMIKVLNDVRQAVGEADLFNTLLQSTSNGDIMVPTEGTQNLIGQLVLAAAIEESGSSISMSLDKLDKLAMELGSVATMLRHK